MDVIDLVRVVWGWVKEGGGGSVKINPIHRGTTLDVSWSGLVPFSFSIHLITPTHPPGSLKVETRR